MDDEASLGLPVAQRIVDGAVVAFAIFTLIANSLVWLGRSHDELMIASAIAAGGALGVAIVRRRRARGGAGSTPARSDEPGSPVPAVAAVEPGEREFARWPWLAASFAVTFGAIFLNSLTAWWFYAIPIAAAALVREIRLDARGGTAAATPLAVPDPRARASRLALAALAVGFSAIVAVAHRSDGDDAFYVNLAVAAVDAPGAPLLSGDTLHGYPDVPFSLPVFAVLSFELFQALLARLFDVGALEIAHVWLPLLVALAVPYAWSRLAQRVLPSTWLWATALVVLSLVFVGDGRASHADFGVLRLQQGKSVLLHVVLPLCTAYAIEFARAPSRRAFLRLAGAQVAAVGLSASGLWLGPMAAAIGLASALPLSLGELARSLRTIAAAAAAAAYPLLLALSLRAATVRAIGDAPHPLAGASWQGQQLVEHAATLVLGDGSWRWLALFALLAGGSLAGEPRFRRFAVVSVTVFLVLFGPFTARSVADGLTGADTYFRVFWLVPLPLFVAALLCGPLRAQRPAWLAASRGRAGVVVVLAALVFGLLPKPHTLSAANDVWIAAPGPRIAPDELAVAREITRRAGPGAFVLAPFDVARWLPLLPQRPRPLMVREMYLDRLLGTLGEAELDRRRALAHTVSGTVRARSAPARLAAAIDAYPLAVVCLSASAAERPELQRVLRDSPLVQVARMADHDIWARPRGEAPDATHAEVP